MNAHLMRAQLLMERRFWAEAEQEARRALAEEAEQPVAMYYLAHSLLLQNKTDQALEAARQAVALGPDASFCHYVLALVYDVQNRLAEAHAACSEAIALDLEDPDLYALKARLFLQEHDWARAAEEAERGLHFDAEHSGCNNARTIALTKLGRHQEAGATIDAVLARAPESAVAHANKGMGLLHQRRPQEALRSFREALRLNPDLEYAREGAIEALKAHNLFYRILLSYFLWMSRLPARMRWAVVIGIYAMFRLSLAVAKRLPQAEWVAIPVMTAYLCFVFVTWTAMPLSNLLLWLHPFGRMALSTAQKRAAAVFGVLLAIGAGGIAAGLAADKMKIFLLGLVAFAMLIPIAETMGREPGRKRRVQAAYAALLAALGVGGAMVPPWRTELLTAFFIGWAIFGWVANIMSTRE